MTDKLLSAEELAKIEKRHISDCRYKMTDDGMSEGIGEEAYETAWQDRAALLSHLRASQNQWRPISEAPKNHDY
jgi:hypothetical protein